MRTAAFLLLATLTAAASAAPVPKHLVKDGDNPDKDKIQGTWKLTAVRVGEMDLLKDLAGIGMSVEIRGDALTVDSIPGGNAAPQRVTAKIKLDVANGVKRFSTTDARKGGTPGKEENVTCGYSIDGNTMTWAMVPTANGKTDLADPAKPGATTVLMVFTRVTDKD